MQRVTDQAWLTPVEIFQPHYATAVARSILKRHDKLYGPGEPLQIAEYGGGNATAALDIISCVEREAPAMYSGMRYRLLEASAALAQAQKARLLAAGVPRDKFEVVHMPSAMWAEETIDVQASDGPWFVVAFELLDNLSHDKLRLVDGPAGTELYEAHVLASTSNNQSRSWEEEFRPLADPVLHGVATMLGLDTREGVNALRHAMLWLPKKDSFGFLEGLQETLSNMMYSMGSVSSQNIQPAVDVFVPTGSWLLLRHICSCFPEHQLTLADFNSFPPSPAEQPVNTPLVQSQQGGHTRDWHGDYLAAPRGHADVMFATHFDSLAIMHAAAESISRTTAVTNGNNAVTNESNTVKNDGEVTNDVESRAVSVETVRATTVSTAEFMRGHADLECVRCLDGYNPLLEDFSNTSILITET